MTAPIRVMLVDDHPGYREGISAAFKKAGIEVVAQADDGEEVVAKALDARPDVILMDISMNAVNGVDATRRLLDRRPDAKVVILSSSSEEPDVIHALKAGACGYLLKTTPTPSIVDWVRRLTAGEKFIFGPEVASMILSEFMRLGTSAPSLSQQEESILTLYEQGLTLAEIAKRKQTTATAVDGIVKAALKKLGR